MGAYEGIDVDQEIVELIRMMDKAEEYRERLQSLQSVWDSLTLLGHLSGTATDMSDTRTAFQQLSGRLLNQLGRETLKKTTLAMKSKAQVAVDIMVRNLFERTADIGFLAMDDDIREYLYKFAPLKSRQVDEEFPLELERYDAKLLARFKEYVEKYSVYANIMLLDTEGNVLLQLDEHNPVRHSKDTLIGVMVDELGEIPEIPMERIEKVSPMLASGNALAESLVKPGAGKTSREMIVVLSAERLRRKFTNVGM
jgi:hypothetical protein